MKKNEVGWGGVRVCVGGGAKQNKTGRKMGERKVEMSEIRRRSRADKNRGEEKRRERR